MMRALLTLAAVTAFKPLAVICLKLTVNQTAEEICESTARFLYCTKLVGRDNLSTRTVVATLPAQVTCSESKGEVITWTLDAKRRDSSAYPIDFTNLPNGGIEFTPQRGVQSYRINCTARNNRTSAQYTVEQIETFDRSPVILAESRDNITVRIHTAGQPKVSWKVPGRDSNSYSVSKLRRIDHHNYVTRLAVDNWRVSDTGLRVTVIASLPWLSMQYKFKVAVSKPYVETPWYYGLKYGVIVLSVIIAQILCTKCWIYTRSRSRLINVNFAGEHITHVRSMFRIAEYYER